MAIQKNIILFHAPKGKLRATIENESSCIAVKPVWASPQTYPGKFLDLLNGKNEEFALIEDPKTLDKNSRDAVESEIKQRYLTAQVESIIEAKQEYGATYWHINSDRGEKDFVTENLQENALWFSPTHLMLLDVDGNRFEITDIPALDKRSQKFIHTIL